MQMAGHPCATDDTSLHGKHCYTTSGLMVGRCTPPFATDGADWLQFGKRGVCDHCGAVLNNLCHIVDAEGRKFTVGTGCISYVGDDGIWRAFKSSPQYRDYQKHLREERDRKVVAEWNALMRDEEACKVLAAYTVERWDSRSGKDISESWLTNANYAWGSCGMAGHARYLKAARDILGWPKTRKPNPSPEPEDAPVPF